MPAPNEVIYSDFSLNLVTHPVSNDLSRLTNNDAVARSVKNLVLTNFYERPFYPKLGSNVKSYLFELFDSITEDNVRTAIIEVLENHEPRVKVLSVIVKADRDGNSMNVQIVFRVSNQTNPTTTEFNLERIR